MKKSRTRSIERIVEEQVLQWQKIRAEKKEKPKGINVITVSREYGSKGTMVAERLAADLGFDLFHREVIQEIAESAHTSTRILETLDEKGLSLLEESIASLVNDRHLWPDQYLRHLMKVVGTIGRHGRAVIIGRCANFILPAGEILSVRVIAPLPIRIKNIAQDLGVSESEAQKRILKTDADRRSFSRKYFYADVSDPINYDLVINTARLSISKAVEAVKAALKRPA